MKLSELKVGMKVRHPDMVYEHEVLKVGDGWVVTTWRSDSDPVCVDVFRKPGDWKVVEPRKKPSEIVSQFMAGRVYEIASCPAGIGFRDLPQYANDRIDAIIQYLDKQASEQN